MAKRGDAELASVMRKLLAEIDQSIVDLTWDRHEKKYVLTLRGSAYIDDEEAQALEEAQS